MSGAAVWGTLVVAVVAHVVALVGAVLLRERDEWRPGRSEVRGAFVLVLAWFGVFAWAVFFWELVWPAPVRLVGAAKLGAVTLGLLAAGLWRDPRRRWRDDL